MSQTMVPILLAIGLVVAFVVYPRVMLRLVGGLVSGLFSLVLDGIALLLVWI